MDMQQLPGMLAKEINKIPNISPQQKGAAFIMALTKLQPMIQAQQAQQFKEQQLKLAQDRLSEKEQYDNQMMDIRGRLADVTAQKANSAETGKAKGALSSDALDFLSDRILSGDKSAAAGMGYGSVGASNRAALQEAVAAKAKERGMSGQELSNINAEYGGTQAGERTIGQRQANVDMFANEAKTMGNILRQQSKDFDRSDFVPLANGEVALAKNTNDPKAVKYVTALNSYINAYAKATNGGAAATVDSKVAARDSLMSGYSDTGIQAALDVNDQELDAALQAPGQVKKEFRNNGKDTQTPAAPASDNIVHWDDLK